MTVNYCSISLLMLVLSCSSALADDAGDARIPPSPPPTEMQYPEMISPNALPSAADPATTPSPGWALTPVPQLYDRPFGFTTPLAKVGWYIRGETMFLHLSRNSTEPLAYELVETTPGNAATITQVGPAITTNDISSQSFGALPRLTLGYRFDDRIVVEAIYFGRNDWSGNASTAASPSGNPAVIYIESPDTLVSDRVSTSLSSALHSAELNVAESFENRRSLEFLAGLRYFRFAEQFQFNSERSDSNDIFQSAYNLQTVNNLYGAQIGTRWTQTWNRFSIVAANKIGLYANNASQAQFLGYSKNSYGVAVRDMSMFKPTLSFIQELGVNGVYHLTDSCVIRGGYNLFVISGLARAGDQIDFSTNPLPALDTHGRAVLHGPSAGIEIRF